MVWGRWVIWGKRERDEGEVQKVIEGQKRMEYRKSGHWKSLLRNWRQPEEPKVYAFLSRIFREWWGEDEVHHGRTTEDVRPMDFTYNMTEGLLQKLDLEEMAACIMEVLWDIFRENKMKIKGKNIGKKAVKQRFKISSSEGTRQFTFGVTYECCLLCSKCQNFSAFLHGSHTYSVHETTL